MEKLKAGADRLGLNLTPAQMEQFQSYYSQLVDWNQRFNLTAITDFEEVQVKHFLDSLSLVLVIKPPPTGFKVVDVGSGAGLPGIPLKLAFPTIELVLIESVGKKIDFLKYTAELLKLQGTEIVLGRAEILAHQPQYREQFDLALGRAVAKLPALLELTLPFCRTGGMVVAQKKGDFYDEMESATNAAEVLGGRLRDIRHVDPQVVPDDRYLIVYDKVKPTPVSFPRRPGMPGKRPL